MSENTLHPSNNNHAPSFPQIPPPHIPKPISESRSEPLGNVSPLQPSPTMRSLPKSLSVDSFVREQQQRDVVGTSPSEPLQSAGTSKSYSRLSSVDPSLERWRAEQQSEHPALTTDIPSIPSKGTSGPELRTLVQRVKRHSRRSGPQTNFSEDDIESSPYEDSEFAVHLMAKNRFKKIQ